MEHLRMTCLRCEQNGVTTPLIPDPTHRHWAFCPVHSPEWVERISREQRTAFMLEQALDQRGKPSRPGGGT